MPSFVKIKSSRNAEIPLSFTDECKSCPSRYFLGSQMCLLTLFAKTFGFTVRDACVKLFFEHACTAI